MSQLFYRWLHLAGVMLVLLSIAPILFHAAIGGSKAANPWRRSLSIAHGVGMLLAFLGGFGVLAKLGMHADLPAWAWIKIVLWLSLGAIFGMAYRLKEKTFLLLVLVFAIALLAAYLGGQKPAFG